MEMLSDNTVSSFRYRQQSQQSLRVAQNLEDVQVLVWRTVSLLILFLKDYVYIYSLFQFYSSDQAILHINLYFSYEVGHCDDTESLSLFDSLIALFFSFKAVSVNSIHFPFLCCFSPLASLLFKKSSFFFRFAYEWYYQVVIRHAIRLDLLQPLTSNLDC